jgi:hypothetical protein
VKNVSGSLATALAINVLADVSPTTPDALLCPMADKRVDPELNLIKESPLEALLRARIESESVVSILTSSFETKLDPGLLVPTPTFPAASITKGVVSFAESST